MQVLHGSNVFVQNPLVKIGRPKVDFGQGFYMTKLREQAESWAQTIASRTRNGKAFLNRYEYDEPRARELAGSRYKVFAAYDMEWLDYVVDCRKGGSLQDRYEDMTEQLTHTCRYTHTLGFSRSHSPVPLTPAVMVLHRETSAQVPPINILKLTHTVIHSVPVGFAHEPTSTNIFFLLLIYF